MSDEIAKIHFEPSTIENIDRSVLDYIKSLKLAVDTNSGFTEVPVLWGTSERSFLSKDKKELRDDQGMLKFPLISIRRSSFSKPLKSGGVFQGNVPEFNDGQGGSLPVGKVIFQERTTAFANAEAMRLHGQNNYPRPNHKVVYQTVYAPMPVNVEVMYEITLRTEYQQQMNDLMLPFVTRPGTINYVLLKSEGHRYEGFIQDQHQSSDNLSDFSAAERKFETKITLKVIGYLVGEGKNEDKSHFSVRQNFVEVKLSRETVTLGEIPDHKNGAYYGLPGVDAEQLSLDAAAILQKMIDRSPGSIGAPRTAPKYMARASNVDVFTDTSTVTNNRVENLVLKEAGVPPGDLRVLTVSDFAIAAGTETILISTSGGIPVEQERGSHYTISGNTITFIKDILDSNRILITYVKG